MIRMLYLVLFVSLLAGCATGQVDQRFASQDGIELSQGSNGYPYFESATFEMPAHSLTGDELPLCVAKTVSNNSVTLHDASGSFVGRYTGNYYQNNNVRESGGGGVISYVSDDKSAVVATGVDKYSFNVSFGIPITRAVRYTLSARSDSAGSVYNFSDITQAQLDTGVLANSGFDPVAAWEGTNPDKVYDLFSGVVRNIEDCLSR